MLIPNGGLTVSIINLKSNTIPVGNQVLAANEKDFIHFSTTQELKKALIAEKEQRIDILDVIPQEILDLLTVGGEGPPVNPSNPDANSGLFYRDEFNRYKQEALESAGFNNFSKVPTYVNGVLTKIEELDGATLKKQTTFTYNGDGSVNTITTLTKGKAVKTTIGYVNGEYALSTNELIEGGL